MPYDYVGNKRLCNCAWTVKKLAVDDMGEDVWEEEDDVNYLDEEEDNYEDEDEDVDIEEVEEEDEEEEYEEEEYEE